MRWLWSTLADPDPRHRGQFQYSGGLIESVANLGIELDVLAMSRSDGQHRDGEIQGSVRWSLGESETRSPLSSFWSSYPNVTNQARTSGLRRKLGQLLADNSYDAVVFDGIAAGWGLGPTLRHLRARKRHTKIVYISHNHETRIRREIARYQAHPVKRRAMGYDAWKVARLEDALLRHSDVITAITENDAEDYRALFPDRPILVLTPGYCGKALANRRFDGELPRRVVIVGTFDWIAKRMNIEDFIAAADPIFAAQGIELEIVGSAGHALVERLSRTTRATRFIGTVPDVSRHLEKARLALVPEQLGGGFKLKVLDYVFHRLPIAALTNSIAGVPLSAPDSVLLFPDYGALARGAASVIDDFERLAGIQERAFSLCRDRFDWSERGKRLVSAMGIQ